MVPQLNIYAIYSLEDKDIVLPLLVKLKPLQEEYNVSIWQDDPIHSEEPWKPQNGARLNQTDLFLLLVSDAFMHSQFIQQLEFKTVIDRYKDGKSAVIPIIIDKCPWDIDFRSDDYNFNLNELQVLPKEGRPIKDWDSSEQAYNNITSSIKARINSLLGDEVQEESKKDEEEKVEIAKTEEQIVLSFNEKKEAEQKRRTKEAESKRIAEESRLKKEAEAKSRAEEEERLRREAEYKRRAEEQRRRDEAETRRLAEEKGQKAAAEVNKRDKQERVFEEENLQEIEVEPNREVEETPPAKGIDPKRRLLVGSLLAILAIIGIWAFSKFNTESEEQPPHMQAFDTITVKDVIVSDEIEMDVPKEEILTKLAVGDTHDGGFIFEIDDDGKTGKIAHFDDAGRMPWKNAMKIHEQLGEGWRLPTFDELRLMQKVIGQGATNSGEFANGLYWSATDYDEYQARLLRFSDGNRSYHYNKEAEHRRFRVRAIRNFSR